MPEQKMGRFRASYLLAAESFEFLRQDKEMLWLPVLSFFANLAFLVVAIGLFVVFAFTVTPEFFDSTLGDIVMYLFLFLGYIGLAYIFTYYQGAIATMVHMRIAGQDPTVKDGLANSRSHKRMIFKWALLAATVGIILRIIDDKLGLAGKIFSFIGSIAWSLVTFFMVPVLVLDNRGLKDSVVRSGQLFRETWGEALIMNFSLSLFIGFLEIVWILLCGVAGFFAISAGSVGLLVLIFVVFLTVFVVVAVVGSVLSGIFKTVLYEYAASGRVPASFTPQLIMGAIRSKNGVTPPAISMPAQTYGDSGT